VQGQRERDPARPPADINDDIIRGNIRGKSLQIRVERSTWIGRQERVVGREPREEVARGLRTTQAGPLREDGIHPRSILLGGGSGSCYRHSLVPPSKNDDGEKTWIGFGHDAINYA
jgi:hypothetical protein